MTTERKETPKYVYWLILFSGVFLVVTQILLGKEGGSNTLKVAIGAAAIAYSIIRLVKKRPKAN